MTVGSGRLLADAEGRARLSGSDRMVGRRGGTVASVIGAAPTTGSALSQSIRSMDYNIFRMYAYFCMFSDLSL